MSDESVQPLTEEDQDRLDEQRAWVVGRALPEFMQQEPIDTVPGRLALLRSLLDPSQSQKPEKEHLHAMGIVFGDALAEYLTLDWCVVSDEEGRSVALQAAGTPIVLFPESMLAKRIEEEERVDVFELFSGIAAQVEAYRLQMGE